MRGETYAMSQEWHAELLDIVGDAVAASVQERAGAGPRSLAEEERVAAISACR